jgi:AcrR family transcriptional regulator
VDTPSRPYHSPRRHQEAERTRQDILRTARDLFLAHGYDRVTMADIARETGIAVKTVYASVGTKSGVLQGVLAAEVAESRSIETLAQLPLAPDLESAMRLVARGTRDDHERFDPTVGLLASAKDSDDGAKQVWDSMVVQYRGALHTTAEHLVGRGLVPPHLDVDATADRLWFCFGLAAWRTLILDCGWDYDTAEDWLARQGVTMLAD